MPGAPWTAREAALMREKNAAIARAKKLEEALNQAEEDLNRAHRIIGALTDEEILAVFRDAWGIADKQPERTRSRVEIAMRYTREYLLHKYPRAIVLH